MEFYTLEFYGLKRNLPLVHISSTKRIANFNILGDIELTEKAGELLEQLLRKKGIIPDCFVGPEVKIVPFVHHLAKRFGHKRYVILRKSVKGYMTSPLVQAPPYKAPKHVKKLVISGPDHEYLKDKRVVLVDDVVSTGSTMFILEAFMKRLQVSVLARCAIFKQGDRVDQNLIYLSDLPVLEASKN